MSVPTDVVQAITEAIVGVLEGAPEVTTITGRAAGSDNVIAWNSLATAPLPVLVYLIVSCMEVGGLAYTWDAEVQLSAFAPVQTDANNLAHAAQQLLIAPQFAALATPIDAYTTNRHRQTLPADPQSGTYRADLSLHVVVTMPTA